jgi:hypothetical protein
MRVDDSCLDQVRTRGFSVIPGFLEPALLAAAQAALWEAYPHPDRYLANPSAYARCTGSGAAA